MRTIFHIATKKEWAEAQAQGFYRTGSLEKEGFIHFSRPQQVLGVSERHFKNAKDLVFLEIEQELIKGELKYEGKEFDKFPHLYGRLNLDAVTQTFEMNFSSAPFQFPKKYKMVGDTLIRPGVISDAAEITNVHIASWRETYTGIVPDTYLNRMPLSFRGRVKFWEYLLTEAQDAKTFVAESAEHGVVGFSKTGDARDPDYQGWGELAAIYLLQHYKKKGIGKALIEMAFDHLKSKGFKKAYCWVLEKNPTLEFYKKSGGKKADVKKTIEIEKELIEVPVEWSISSENESENQSV